MSTRTSLPTTRRAFPGLHLHGLRTTPLPIPIDIYITTATTQLNPSHSVHLSPSITDSTTKQEFQNQPAKTPIRPLDMANSAAVSNAAGGSDIGDRLSRLGLPSRPYIMEKFDQKCSVHPSGRCFCYEYITLLHRPDHAYRADSPDPETRKKPAVNGSSAPKKKLNLGDYIAKKNSGAHSERRSMERSPVKNGLPTSGLASTPKTDPVPRERDLSFKSMPKLTNDKLPPPRSVPERETALSSSRKDVGSSLKAQKQVAGKRYVPLLWCEDA